MFITIPALIVLFLIFGVPMIARQFSKGEQPGKGAPVPVESPSPGTPQKPSPSGVQRAVSQWRITGTLYASGGENWVWLQAGDRYVRLDVDRYCDRDAGGFIICTWQGQTISNEIRFLPERRTMLSPGASVAVVPTASIAQ